MQTVRAFIALNIGDDIRNHLAELIRDLKASGADVRWVKPENLHLTLAFLGQVNTGKFQPLETALRTGFQSLEPFGITAVGTGVFGPRLRPGVVWAGIRENAELMRLQQHVVAALEQAEVRFDNKAFRPHLTLGRFKSLNQSEALFQSLEKCRHQPFGHGTIRSVEIIKSELKPTGAAYTVLQSVPLTEG